jgi:hypothetical protein
LDGFEINCIWSSLGKLDFERFFGMEESHWRHRCEVNEWTQSWTFKYWKIRTIKLWK